MKADLHVHTTASDGRLSPLQVVHLAASRGIGILAITDHDTVAGIVPAFEAAQELPSIRVIPGVEISTDVPDGEVHILGYFIDFTTPALIETLARLRNSRRERAQKMLVKLSGMGVNIDWERVKALAGGGSIGRPHIARAMLEQGHVSTVKEAFVRYIGRGGPAYVQRAKVSPAEAVALIRDAGGLPMLAHPAEIGGLDAVIEALKEEGLRGIEAYYNGYARETVRRLVLAARKHGLVTGGGSDYHGLDDGSETMLGESGLPMDAVSLILSLAEATPDSRLQKGATLPR